MKPKSALVFDLVFKLVATYGDIEDMLPIGYEKLCFPFISLIFCTLLVGSSVTVDLHASVHCHANNFIAQYTTPELIL